MRRCRWGRGSGVRAKEKAPGGRLAGKSSVIVGSADGSLDHTPARRARILLLIPGMLLPGFEGPGGRGRCRDRVSHLVGTIGPLAAHTAFFSKRQRRYSSRGRRRRAKAGRRAASVPGSKDAATAREGAGARRGAGSVAGCRRAPAIQTIRCRRSWATSSPGSAPARCASPSAGRRGRGSGSAATSSSGCARRRVPVRKRLDRLHPRQARKAANPHAGDAQRRPERAGRDLAPVHDRPRA